MFDGWFTRQLLFDGLVTGMVFGLVAMGIVLIYRSTRVINFAVANIGFIGAGLLRPARGRSTTSRSGSAAVIGIVVGTLYGAIIELIVIRRLFTAPRVIVLVATIGIAQLSLVILIAYPEIDAPGARFPVPIGAVNEVAGVRIVGPQLTILIVVPLIAIGARLAAQPHGAGQGRQGVGREPRPGPPLGHQPEDGLDRGLGPRRRGLATLSLSLLAGMSGSAQNLDNLGPSTLTRALAAAVIAGMVSFPRAFLAGDRHRRRRRRSSASTTSTSQV